MEAPTVAVVPEMSESLRASAMPQFDLLWFDLMTKTRQLIEDVCAPIMDRLETHKCQIVTLEKLESSQSERLHLLEDLFLQKNQKNSAFDAITERMLDMVSFISHLCVNRTTIAGSTSTALSAG